MSSLPMRVIPGAAVLDRVDGDREACLDLVRRAYLTHHAGDSSNPHSSFLRFPDRPRDRIIALPAYLGGDFGVAGIKWIASFPGNTANGIPRASAVLVLNDLDTGYPFVCMESSIVSATRTAASAVLGGEALIGGRVASKVGFVGTGLIASHVWRFLRDLAWKMDEIRVFDLDVEAAKRFQETLAADGFHNVTIVDSAADTFATDLVVLATIAGEPHLHDLSLLATRPVVLHLSLRDLAPELILAAQNITDDVDHAVRERTSLHLTEDLVGHRDFIHGTIGDVLTGAVTRDQERAAIFAPFGLGVLDLAIGKWVHDSAADAAVGTDIPEFFPVS